MDKEKSFVQKVGSSIDWQLMFTLILTAIVLALIVYGMKKSGFKFMKDVAVNV